MKKYRFLIKLISMIIVVSVFCSSSIISVYSAAGTIFESEGNNSVSSADWTYNDYDSYGSISYSNDVDYWKVTFSYEGMANFYLGNIPSGRDYDMDICDSTGTARWAVDLQFGNNHELVRLHVKANTTYYVRIYSTKSHYSPSNYLFRVKLSYLNEASYYSYTSQANLLHNLPDIDTVANGENALVRFSEMHFTDKYNFINNEAASVISCMPFSQVMIVDNHSSAGLMVLPSLSDVSVLYAASNSQMTSDDRAISTLANSSLSNTSLVVFFGVDTGLSDLSGNNLVDMVISKGAITSFGWKDALSEPCTEIWMDSFLYYCAQGLTVYSAGIYADTALVNMINTQVTDSVKRAELLQEANLIKNRYYGSSRAEANAKSTVLSLCQ